MQVTAAGFQLLDPTLAPLGTNVPFSKWEEMLWSTDPFEQLDVDIVFDPDAFGPLTGDWILVQ